MNSRSIELFKLLWKTIEKKLSFRSITERKLDGIQLETRDLVCSRQDMLKEKSAAENVI
jgi:hypothetical protein